jgi:hypothetical protein
MNKSYYQENYYQELGKRPICTFHCHGFLNPTILKNYTVTMFLGPILSSTPEKYRLHGQCQVSPRGGLFFVGFVCYHRPGHAVHPRSLGIEARHSVFHARQLLHKGTGRISLQVYFQVRPFFFILSRLLRLNVAQNLFCGLNCFTISWGPFLWGPFLRASKPGIFSFVFLSRIIHVGIHMPCNSVSHQ